MTGVDDATTTFTNIANAIRSKTGTSSKMKITEMASKINGISVGITPSGTKSITSNGTYDITSYQYVSVNVDSTPNISGVGASLGAQEYFEEDSGYYYHQGITYVVWSVKSNIPSSLTATINVSGSGTAKYSNGSRTYTTTVKFSGSRSLTNSELKNGSATVYGSLIFAGTGSDGFYNPTIINGTASISIKLSDGSTGSGSVSISSS